MNETVIAALIGVIAGTLPVLLTRVFAVLESRSSWQQQKKQIELTKLQLETIEQYISVAKSVLPSQTFTDTSIDITRRLTEIQANLLTAGCPANDIIGYKDRPWVQRLLLFYPAQSSAGWIWRLLYYMTGFGITAIFIDLYRTGEAFTGIDETGEFTWSYFIGEFIGAFLFMLVPYFFHRKAMKSD